MTVIAVTGHIRLTEASLPLVREALRETLAPYAGDLTGVSCLAAGADSLFAEVVLELGGRLVAVVPSRDYRSAVVTPEHAGTFDRLVEAADDVTVLDRPVADAAAYEAANQEMLRRAERLVAVWDGAPPGGQGGGTADAVLTARAGGLPVDVVWPEGAARGA
ncbi:hypothetical protein MTQ10_28520 [Streptomyces sp. XM83C]|jgi:hypothetical protein|uniref:Uncharacterized protein n=1 Tax=Streptomyces thermocoprophilus TaxID=78356 RepID=A0ABV5VG56_9ACTN|nr:hypothetical protein [Streptomyces sp. XM83C]MCK1823428.1 hypothetical protein [Streptomyces sp. XM83C]